MIFPNESTDKSLSAISSLTGDYKKLTSAVNMASKSLEMLQLKGAMTSDVGGATNGTTIGNVHRSMALSASSIPNAS